MSRFTFLLVNSILALVLVILSVWSVRSVYQWFTMNYMIHGYLIYKCPSDIATEYVNGYLGAPNDFCSTIESRDGLFFSPDADTITAKANSWSHSISYTNSLTIDGKHLSNDKVYFKIW